MRRKEYEGRESKAKVASTEVKDWSNFRDESPMNQRESGSMDYLRRKDAFASEDNRKISGMLRGVSHVKD